MPTKTKKNTKLAFHIMKIVFSIVLVLCTLQTSIIARRARVLTAASYEEEFGKITEGYASTVSSRISEYIKQMRMYTAADIVSTEDSEEI